MAKIVIFTQIYENYGAHDWDGQGECPQQWKPKGGNEYVLNNFSDFMNVNEVVTRLSPQIVKKDHYWHEYIIDWDVLADNELTPDEKMQQTYSGQVRYRPMELVPA